jgi:TatD DNase family protein
MIDAHCHLDQYPNPERLASECERLGILTVAMTNLPSHFEIGLQHLRGHRYIKLALGLHPLYGEVHKKEFAKFLRNIDKTSHIGEIGLDFSRDGIRTKRTQEDTFKSILSALDGRSRILSLHSRNAEEEVLANLVQHKVKTAIFHWYSGPLSFVDDIVAEGYMFSINPAMIRSKSGLSIIQKIPMRNLLTESDGPFVMIGKDPAKPSDMNVLQEYLSSLWSISAEDVEFQIHTNYSRLVRSSEIPPPRATEEKS